MSRARVPRLGLDLGGVIIDKYMIDPETGERFRRRHPKLPEVDGAFVAIAGLVKDFEFPPNVYRGRHVRRKDSDDRKLKVFIVTSGYPKVVTSRILWLDEHDFENRTGLCVSSPYKQLAKVPRSERSTYQVKKSVLRFPGERDRKDLYCAQLGLTHFVDDRLDVLEKISREDVPYQYLLRVHDTDEQFAALVTTLPGHIKAFRNWDDLKHVLRRDLERMQDAYDAEMAYAV